MTIVGRDDLLKLGVEFLRCLEFLKPAIEIHKTHSIIDIFGMLVNGTAFLVALKNSAGVLEIVEYPKYKSCRIWLAGGNMEEMINIYPEIQKWAKYRQCKKIEIIGRKGWEKVFKDHKKEAVVLTREL
tara:strand:+ start:1487 stop:1870 length:384 start_codon:yes stop_codon:yes gene_type:complete